MPCCIILLLQIDAAELIEEEEIIEQRLAVVPKTLYVVESLISKVRLTMFSPLLSPSSCRTYRSRVEELKRKKMELAAARSSRTNKLSEVSGPKAEQDGSSSEDEDEDDESFSVDWRAQHL